MASPTITGTITANAAPPPAVPAGYDARDPLPLSEPRRAQLDGIVQQMQANKEPDANIATVVQDFKSKYATPAAAPAPAPAAAAPVDNSALGQTSRLAAAFDKRMVETHDPRNLVKGLMSAPDAQGLGKLVPSMVTADAAERDRIAAQARQDFASGHYGAAAVHGLDSIVPILGPMINRAGHAAASGSPEELGTSLADVTSLKTVPEVYGAAGGAAKAGAEATAEAASKYAPRVVENAPAVGAALVKGAKAVVPDLARGTAAYFVPFVGKPLSAGAVIQAARNLVASGAASDLRTALSDLLSKPATAEVNAASKAHGAAVPWRQFSDVQAELRDDLQPEHEAAQEAALPSGRTPGSIEKQAPELAAAPLGPRRAPLRANLAPAEQPAAAETPAATVEASLPSGKKPGGIQNQITEAKPAEAIAPEAAPEPTPPGAAPAEPTIKPLDRELTAAERMVKQSVDNKTAVLASYAHANAIDLAQFEQPAARIQQFVDEKKFPPGTRTAAIRKAATAADRADIVAALDHVQAFADAAYAHGVEQGLPVPAKGYHGISPDTWGLVRQRVPERADLAPTGDAVPASSDAGRSGSDLRSSLPDEQGRIPDAGRSDEPGHGNAAPAAASPGSGLKPKSGAQIEAERRHAEAKAKKKARSTSARDPSR
jgi:hypothetical protein